jgi:hypothetical protein
MLGGWYVTLMSEFRLPCVRVQVRCVSTGLTARLRFKEAGLIFDKDPRQVRQ